ncbi:MAG: signal peptidase I [Proteobacteria bacterium]|nr:signal peptidase I [Pseudomonadota bacterium]
MTKSPANPSLLRRILFPAPDTGMYAVFMEYLRILVTALLIAGSIRTFLFEPYKIPSSSMMPTLLIGDFLFVNKYTFGTHIPFTDIRFGTRAPERGDIVVFRKSLAGQPVTNYIKRIVGVPGDTLAYRDKHLYINEVKQPQTLVGPFSYEDGGRSIHGQIFTEQLGDVEHSVLIEPGEGEQVFSTVVPEGKFAVVGDNRDNSFDSRAWNRPYWSFIDQTEIVGRAEFLFWSWDSHFIPRLDRVFGTLRAPHKAQG